MIAGLSKAETRDGPPGPPFMEFISALVKSRREPLEFARGLVERYGDVVSYRVGPHTGYVVRHPDHLRRILSERHRSYGKSNFNYQALKPVLGNGLITSEGEQWARARRKIQTLFRRRRVDGFAPAISRVTCDMLARWDDASDRGDEFDVACEMSTLSMRVIGTVLFGKDLRAETLDSVAANFNVLNEDVAYRFRNPFSIPRWVPTRRNRAFKRALHALESEIHHIIDACRSESAREDNLINLLDESADSAVPNAKAGESVRQLRDHTMTLILAGFETTAALLAWTWFLLAIHPRWVDRIRRELPQRSGECDVEVERITGLPCLKAVIEEALRLYPPVWVISRKAQTDDELGGYRVPAGTVVTISSYLVHRHPAFWRHADRFDPERFLEHPVERRHPFSYLPFGAGPRQCPGSHLAVVETMLVLAETLRRYDPQVPSGERGGPDPLVTLRPKIALRAARRAD